MRPVQPFRLTLYAICAALLASVSSGQAATVEEGLARALERGLPPEGIAIGVALLADDLPPAGPPRRARVQARQRRVLDALPRGGFILKRRYQSVSGLAGWAQRPAIQALLDHPEVASVYLDGRVRATLAQGVVLVGAASAHPQGFTGAGVNVAVLDTGVDSNHPDLSDDLVAEQCFCDDHPSPNFACCPDGGATQSGPGAAEDDEGHGTGVAGILTSRALVSSAGVAPDAGLVAVKVLDSSGSGSFSDIAAALDWVLTNHGPLGVRVVNLSLGDGGEYNDPSTSPCSGTNTANAIRDLHAVGVAVFASSGNEAHDDGISFPACAPEAISVGGVYDASLGSLSWCANASCSSILCTDSGTTADTFVCHSNSDEILDLTAPNWRTDTAGLGGGTTAFGGTSASSPYAAGQASILVQADETVTPEQIRTLLKGHGPLITNPDNGLSFRRSAICPALGELLGDLDGDGDGVSTPCDNCSFEPNLQQADADGDAIGDACQCGDLNDDGLVDGADLAFFRTHLADPIGSPLSPAGALKCTVFGTASSCDLVQAVVLRRAVDGSSLAPGLAQVCDAALP